MIDVARHTRKFSFSHRSKHKIGASVLTADGEIYGGREVLKKLLDDFRVRYANRRAMLEMINKAFPDV